MLTLVEIYAEPFCFSRNRMLVNSCNVYTSKNKFERDVSKWSREETCFYTSYIYQYSISGFSGATQPVKEEVK